MEEKILLEANFFVEALRETKESPTSPKSPLRLAVSNVACHIIFGNRFSYSDQHLKNMDFDEFLFKTFAIGLVPFLEVDSTLFYLLLHYSAH